MEEDNITLRSKLNDLDASVSNSVFMKEKESLKFQLETSESSRKELVEKNKDLTEKLRNSTFDFKVSKIYNILLILRRMMQQMPLLSSDNY